MTHGRPIKTLKAGALNAVYKSVKGSLVKESAPDDPKYK
jgi:hypothetical protein